MDIFKANNHLARTMNFGLALDAPSEGEWGLSIRHRHLQACAKAGFTAIRLPVQWATRMSSEEPYTIDDGALDRLHQLTDQANRLGLAVIITNHPDEMLMAQPAQHGPRLLALWKQLGEQFADKPDGRVFFEPLSEPHGALEAGWNQLFDDVLATIRATNQSRPVIVGSIGFNRADKLGELVLPDDRHLIVTFHWYLPIEFTMQGEEYLQDIVPLDTIRGWVGNSWDEHDAEYAKAQRIFAGVADWAKQHNRPVFLGEFGVGDKAEMASKAAWIRAHRLLAEKHGFSWGYWSFGAAFSAYDISIDDWRPPILEALIQD